MRAICISDIHSNFSAFPVDSLPDGDICLIAGDITNLGVYRPAEMWFADFWLKELEEKYRFVAHIKGNHDIGVLPDGYYESGSVVNVQDKSMRVKFGGKGRLIRGANLSVCYNMPSLKQRWTNMTDNPEVEAAYYGTMKPCDILISHSPPSGPLGIASDGSDCGSTALRAYIERHQPELVVCGHLHEQGGKEERIGKTLVVNTALRVTEVDL